MTESRTVTIRRTFDAPIALVYRAWAEAEHVVRWMKCGADVTLEVENWEPSVGREFRTRMTQPGVFTSTSVGRFLEVDPPRVLAYETDADPNLGVPKMTVRVTLCEVDGQTEVTLEHTGIPNENIFGVIRGGWSTSLSQLDELLPELVGTSTPPSERDEVS